jgi:uncharacterized protein YjbI with pentapeptide repeats
MLRADLRSAILRRADLSGALIAPLIWTLWVGELLTLS